MRALLGAISPKIRLVKVSSSASVIEFAAFADADLDDQESSALATAAAEIAADFPDCTIAERIIIETGPLPHEDVLKAGWIYRRYE